MRVDKFLDKVAYIFKHEEFGEIYKSKFDDSYITHVGMEDHAKFLANLEITEQLTHGVGFSPKDNKWYGWSHRAIFGFEIGSECKKGDCAYIAATPEELINDHVDWMDYEDTVKDHSGAQTVFGGMHFNTGGSGTFEVQALLDEEGEVKEIKMILG